ncbi:HU family DNA-binding protein [Ferrimonas gelatinilytica]|uniref:HU family DNA-binding protein n=1 Tax=Ferrimonas gelatinilytica TaxID=1255257 RepID=A0ABP9RX09_9GAMM
MTRKELIRRITDEGQLTPEQAKVFLDRLVTTITQALHEGERVYLPKFGIFEIRHHLPRTGRNPVTGEPVSIPLRTVPSFRPAEALKKQIHSPH